MEENYLKKIAYIFATGFGAGYFPIAPGTAGSLVALSLFVILPLSNIAWLIICILFFSIGIWASNVVEEDIGRGSDPGIVVIDEFIGQWIAVIFLPRGILIFAISFLLFRVFDIFKIYPANISQNIKGGFGIMIDDIIAGLYANILLQFYFYFF